MVRFRAPARLIALAVAYALATQGLLSAMIPPAVGAPTPLLVLCAALADGSAGETPLDHRPGTADCAACMLGGCAGGASLPPVDAAISILDWVKPVVAVPTDVGLLAPPTIRTPQNPRGPPPV